MSPHRQRMIRSAPTLSVIGTAIAAPRAPMKDKEAVEQMADDMRIINTRMGNVTSDDLSLLGWTAAQIAKHAQAAREKAAAQSLVLL